MRAFLAVELPADIRRALTHLQSQLAQPRADVKWTEEANLHVTMRFLGEITEQQRQGLEEMLRGAASHHPVATIQLTGLGAFPSLESPRILWIGVGEGKDWLTQLAGEFERELVLLGFAKEERPFAAHVTLGRVRSPRGRAQLMAAMRESAWRPPEPFCATHLTLFQSTLTSAGARYTPLASFPFV